MKQIAVIVFLPMLAGFITQQSLVKKYGIKEFQQRLAPRFPSLSTIGVIGIVFIAIALKAKGIASSPKMLLYILMPLLSIYIINYLISTFVGKAFLKRSDAIAMVYGSVMRNLSIALAIAINAFGTEGASAALVIAIAYIIQVQSAAWYVKFTDKIFEKIPYSNSDIKHPIKELSPAVKTSDDPFFVHGGAILPNLKNILYATDLSETARYAVRYACSIKNRFHRRERINYGIFDYRRRRGGNERRKQS